MNDHATPPSIGFLGFGEAARLLATDLVKSGYSGKLLGYSRRGAKAAPGDPALAQAQAAGVQLTKTVAALAKGSDLILALTPGKAALPALKKILRHLRPDQLYVDASSNSAKAMEQAAALVGDKARFVDAAILAPVDLQGLKSPFVASGPHAAEFRDRMTPHGLMIRVVGEAAGDASAMKLIRSAFTKSLAAILIESMEAARRRGILDVMTGDIAKTFSEIPFDKIIRRYISGTAVHCERRLHEMQDCLALLREMGSGDRSTMATVNTLRELIRMDMPAKFPKEPESIHPVLDAIIAARDKAA
jgi:3-hydroxyisobutyrate dehydrogenase-like beta-hydroxyacid dehydrogenase